MTHTVNSIIKHTIENQIRIDSNTRHKVIVGVVLLAVFIGSLFSYMSSLYIGVLISTLSVAIQIARGLYDTQNIVILPVAFTWYILLYAGIATLIRLI